ncbi:MAG TPA: J domain-containing protein [Chitinophagaceae bacterium]|nr:J domain-containing protein [Chitinophagaceae bacterium]
MRKDQSTTASSLKKFISSSSICVLYAQRGIGLRFNKYLKQSLKDKYKDGVTTGVLDLSRVRYTNVEIAEFVTKWIPNLGLPRTRTIYPGYYLFRNGLLIGYHPGNVEIKNTNVKLDGTLTLLTAGTALLHGIVTKNARTGLETFVEGMHLIKALKILHFFESVLKIKEWNESAKKHQFVLEDELNKAYKILLVTPDSTDEEINKSWRKLVKENHPDKSPHDKEVKNKITTEINKAYNLIKTTRLKTKNHQTVSDS